MPSTYTLVRYDIKRAGYIIVTSEGDDGDILNPMVMQAAMQLWSVVQTLTIESSDNRTSYPSMCVKFPMPAEFNEAIAAFLSTNITRQVSTYVVANEMSLAPTRYV